jgi:hypothetical protein
MYLLLLYRGDWVLWQAVNRGISVTVWGRLNALYVRLYIGPCVDLWVLQCVNITEGNKSVWKLVWFSTRVVNNTQGFLQWRRRVQLIFVRNPLVLRQDGRRETWLLFWLRKSEQNWLNRGLWIPSFRALEYKSQGKWGFIDGEEPNVRGRTEGR